MDVMMNVLHVGMRAQMYMYACAFVREHTEKVHVVTGARVLRCDSAIIRDVRVEIREAASINIVQQPLPFD